jgi:hypothetical protein
MCRAGGAPAGRPPGGGRAGRQRPARPARAGALHPDPILFCAGWGAHVREVLEQVIGVLDADRDAHQPVHDAGLLHRPRPPRLPTYLTLTLGRGPNPIASLPRRQPRARRPAPWRRTPGRPSRVPAGLERPAQQRRLLGCRLRCRGARKGQEAEGKRRGMRGRLLRTRTRARGRARRGAAGVRIGHAWRPASPRCRCEVSAGCVTSVSTPPRLGATAGSSSACTTAPARQVHTLS